MPPLPSHRARHPAYFYPTVEATRARVARLKEQHRRLDARKARLSALDLELAEAKSEVDSACADARSSELRARYGTETLRVAREAAKQAYSALVRERKTLVGSVAETGRMVSSVHATGNILSDVCAGRVGGGGGLPGRYSSSSGRFGHRVVTRIRCFCGCSVACLYGRGDPLVPFLLLLLMI